MSTPILYDILSQKLEQKRKDHPSIKLMEIDDRLFPKGLAKNSEITLEALNSNNELKTVKEIVAESWEKDYQNHLIIEGEGGIGKTVTLLNIPNRFDGIIPAIYIPLHEVKGAKESETIKDYILDRVLDNDTELLNQMMAIIKQPWRKGPQLLLLLDGFNEIADKHRESFSYDIERWSQYPGIQIITSSRFDIHSYLCLSYDPSYHIKLQPLSVDTVERYLNSLNIPIPSDITIKKLITIPLLLILYLRTELLIRSDKKPKSACFKDSKNAGSLVWNYLQCELWRFRRNNENTKTCILTMEFIAPYIAWQMQKNSLFVLDEKTFSELLEKAYCLLQNQFKYRNKFPVQIKQALQKANGIPQLDCIRIFLEEQISLFVQNDGNYRLMHQQFRDALAAIHLINSSYFSGEYLPLEEWWDNAIDYNVMQFVVDLISDEEASKLWEQNRKTKPADTATRNQLELQKRLHNCDFSNLNFSGIDLRNISMYPYRASIAKLKLPPYAKYMEGTYISEKTFSAEGHDNWVNAIAITPNGKFIISGSNDLTIRIWDLKTGDLIKTIEGHENWVSSVSLTPNGKFIVSGAFDHTIRIWELETGRLVNTLKGHKSWINTVAVTPNGEFIISGSNDNSICIWDFETGSLINTLHEDGLLVNTLAISPNGKFIISGADDNICIWELKNNCPINTIEIHKGSVNAVAVTPNSKFIVAGISDYIRIWELESGKTIRILEGQEGLVQVVAITPNGQYIVSGADDNSIRIWEVETGNLNRTLEGHKGSVDALSITPNGKFIISGAKDNTVRIWNLETGNLIRTLEKPEGWVQSVAITPDENFTISGLYDHTIRIWGLKTKNQIRVLEGHKGAINAVAITSNGKFIVSGAEDNTIRIWEWESGYLLRTFEVYKNWVNAIAITPNGKFIVTGAEDSVIRIWDFETGDLVRTLKGYDNWLFAFAIPNEKFIVSGAEDGTIRIWDLETGNLITTLKIFEDSVDALTLTSNGKFIVCGSTDGISIWDLRTGCLIRTLEGQADLISAIASTPNFKFIVYSNETSINRSYYGTICITNTNTFEINTIHILPISLVGLDFSKAIISTPELKETLRQNGAKVDSD